MNLKIKDMNKLFREAVKAQLVQMTINDELPTDMTTLDIDDVFSKAEKSLETNEEYKRVSKIKNLSKFVSFNSEISISSMLDTLEKYHDGKEIVGYIEGIDMLDRYATSFTVDQLIEEIS